MKKARTRLKFCRACGKELIKDESSYYYDEMTGQKEYYYKCSEFDDAIEVEKRTLNAYTKEERQYDDNLTILRMLFGMDKPREYYMKTTIKWNEHTHELNRNLNITKDNNEEN